MRKKMNSMKWLPLFMMVILILSGCGAKSESAADMAAPMEMKEEAYVEEAAVEMETAEGSGVQADELGDPNRKLIKKYYLYAETKEFDTLIDYIETAVASAGGYIENSNTSAASYYGDGSRSAHYVLRVPVADAASIVAGLEEKAHITEKSEEVDDVTLAYVDTKSRIEALRIEQEALMEMLEQADNLDTIIGLQSRLTEVRYEIESYESQIRSYDNLIEYTTITLNISEVEKESADAETTFGEMIQDSFGNGLHALGSILEGLILALAWLLPGLIFIAVIVIVILLIVFTIRKSMKKKEKKMDEMMGVTKKQE